MTKISYFPRYSQRENFITNSSLHLLYRLYDTNRRRFHSFLSYLLQKAEAEINEVGEIGLQIQQQTKSKASVIDGFLYQDSIRIGIETKLNGIEFSNQQLINHLSLFKNANSGYLLLLHPTKVDLKGNEWHELREKSQQKNIIVASVTFEEIIESFRLCLLPHEEEMLDLIDDFEAFCSKEGLLNQDRLTIFAPPCGQSFDINVRYKLYFCPENRPLRHVEYLGIYKERAIRHIGKIVKVVFPKQKDTGELIFQDEEGNPIALPQDMQDRILAASEEAEQKNGWLIKSGHKFFLCDQLVGTNFMKSTPYGIMGHRYFNVRDYLRDYSSLEIIARGLNGLAWENTLNQR